MRGQLHLLSPDGHDMLELHWHPINPSRVRHTLSVTADDLWSDASRTRVAGADVWVPRTSRELAHLCLHAALHGCDRLIWLVDIHKVMDSPDLDLDDLQRTARRWGFGAGTYLVLALVDRWLGSLAAPTGSLEAPPGPRDPRRVPPARGPVGPWPARSRRAVPAAALRDRGRRPGAPRQADLVTRGAAGRQRSGCGQGATRPAAFQDDDRRGDQGPAQARRACRGRCRTRIPSARGPCRRTRPVSGARRIRTIRHQVTVICYGAGGSSHRLSARAASSWLSVPYGSRSRLTGAPARFPLP